MKTEESPPDKELFHTTRGSRHPFLTPLLAILLTLILIGVPSSQGQPVSAKIRYGAYPLKRASITKLKRDLARDAIAYKLNKVRCQKKPLAKKLSFCDADFDGLVNSREKLLGTKYLSNDTDRDGLKDKQELLKYHTDPLRADTDGNGIKDGDEDSNANGMADEDEDDKPGEGSTYEDLNDEGVSNGCPATNFDQSGNTVEFGIPSPNIGNLTRGETSYNQICYNCHKLAEVGTNYEFTALKTRIAQAPMNISTLPNSKLADIVAYLNRTQTGEPIRCITDPSGTPTPVPPGTGTAIPTPTATPVGTSCGNAYFDINSNTNQFGIPSPLVGNLTRGNTYFVSQFCGTSCHIEKGVGFSFAQLKTALTGPKMNRTQDTDQNIADLAAYANRSLANVGCSGGPTPTPGPTSTPTRTPTIAPTPTSSGCSNSFFDANGSTMPSQFSIPSPLIGSIGTGSGIYNASCSGGCHTNSNESAHGLNMTFTQLKAAVTGTNGGPMRLVNVVVTDQQYADMTAYLNRSSAPQNCGGAPTPTPTPLSNYALGRLKFLSTCTGTGCHNLPNQRMGDLRGASTTKINRSLTDVSEMRARNITLTQQQLVQLAAYLANPT